jgi:pyridoxamine 5'-phosphate oxidase
MTLPDLASIRNEYALKTLDESQVDRDPLRQFGVWMVEAIHAQVPEPTAMSLSTVGKDGRPAGRIVLLKGVDASGFVFYTNYESRKGRDLAAHPFAALTFMWKELERQVRIEGDVEKVSGAESDEYFNTRPLGSRVGAWASPQSSPIESREWLEQRWSALAVEHGTTPARPANWGGYRVRPEHIEFWQGRMSRLHDRIAYSRLANAWEIVRLAP